MADAAMDDAMFVTTQKGRDFITTPLAAMEGVDMLPALGGEKNTRVLKRMGITAAKQVFGLYLQFNDPEDFADFLEGKGARFPNDKLRQELLAVLGAKWEVIKNL
jgi:hypothetical protein